MTFLRSVLLLSALVLAGCATHGDKLQQALDKTRTGDYVQAEQLTRSALPDEGKDRLLHYLELGLLKHLQGDYSASNRLLEKAKWLAEELYTIRAGELLATALTNPSNSDYRGAVHERVYIHYYKLLNYLLLAQQAEQARVREHHLDSARVESRRLGLLLDENVFKTGTYEEAKNEKEQLFSKVVQVFRRLEGEPFDPEDLLFRDDAYLHYISGVLYELNDEPDSARIAYQRAAEVYEQGYSRQYRLADSMAEQAWFDTVRMMRRAGGWEEEWPQLARDKLTEAQRRQLEQSAAEQAELLVIQHVGMMPQREVLNLHLRLDPAARQLVIRPVLTGTPRQQQDQALWFYLLYADKGLTDLVRDYIDGKLWGLTRLFNSKTVSLGPVWDLVEETGLVQALGGLGIRIAVPYYPLQTRLVQASELWQESQVLGSLDKVDSIAHLGLLQQLRTATGELHGAIAREVVRNLMVQKAAGQMGEYAALASLGGKLLTAGTTGADTRGWLLLPHHVRLLRLPLAPGNHELTLKTRLITGGELKTQQVVSLQPGELKLWRQRTLLPQEQVQSVEQLRMARRQTDAIE